MLVQDSILKGFKGPNISLNFYIFEVSEWHKILYHPSAIFKKCEMMESESVVQLTVSDFYGDSMLSYEVAKLSRKKEGK